MERFQVVKTCNRCLVEKDDDEFHWRSEASRPNRRRGTCKQCSHRDSTVSTYISRHGISQEDVAELAKEQGGCAICGTQEPPGRGNGWHIDHDHSCQNCTVRRGSCDDCRRGVLCAPCNTALGLFGDNVSVLSDAASYLADWQMSRAEA